MSMQNGQVPQSERWQAAQFLQRVLRRRGCPVPVKFGDNLAPPSPGE